jgi:peroxiredoxin
MRSFILCLLVLEVLRSSVAAAAPAKPAAPGPTPNSSSAERQQLEAALALTDPQSQATKLAQLIALAHDPETRGYAHHALAQTYARLRSAGAPVSADIEEQLLRPALPPVEVLSVCYSLVGTPGVARLLDRCLASVPPNVADPELAAERSRLAGTLAFERGDFRNAQRLLSAAAVLIPLERDSTMRLRLSRAQRETGKLKPACATARALYRAAPLLDGAKEALAACGDASAVAASLTKERRQSFLATRRQKGEPLKPLSLEDEQGRPVELEPAKLGKVTVLVFFSTWCPHCGLELPRLVTFAKALATDAKRAAQVEIVGIRTAVEREREPYAAFAARAGLNFRVLVDPTLALGFVAFAKAVGVPAGLPMVAVLDNKGVVRFVLEAGDYRDTATEVAWAVEALVGG